MLQKLLSNPKLYLFNEFKAKGKPAKAAKIRTKKKISPKCCYYSYCASQKFSFFFSVVVFTRFSNLNSARRGIFPTKKCDRRFVKQMAVKEIAVSDASRVKARFLWSLLCIVRLLFYPFSFGTLLTFVSWKVLSTHWLLLSLYRKRLRGARRANLFAEFRKAAFAWDWTFSWEKLTFDFRSRISEIVWFKERIVHSYKVCKLDMLHFEVQDGQDKF